MTMSLGGKRDLLAHGLFRSGIAAIIRSFPRRSCLLVLNYHRIGNPDTDPFDPGVFSATTDELDAQVAFVKRHCQCVTLAEALDFIERSEARRAKGCRVLFTFDDGYLDNYQLAFPVFRSHGVQGVFFLPTSLVGSCTVPWWDGIAYLMKTGSRRRFTLGYPVSLDVDLDTNGMIRSLGDVLSLYKRPDNTDPERFFSQLREASGGREPPQGQRRFLSWEEAREMLRGGMALGSHTHSHTVLSQLELDAQRQELSRSRDQFMDHLGVDVEALAYPVGSKSTFTEVTQRLARECGYRAAFSFYGGINLPGPTNCYDVMRIGIGDQSPVRFRVQVSFCASLGRFWP